MSDLNYIVSMPFLRKGKETLKDNEFILALSIDLNWFTPEAAKNTLAQAEKEGLVKREGGNIIPSFDISSVKIPEGFRPHKDVFEKKSLFDRTIERVTQATGMEKRKVISLINKKHEELSKLVEIEVSAILVALEQGITADDLIEEENTALLNPLPSS
ncbi:MAG TPA: DUF2240 family protein [Candidatus Methanoperedens sp.]